jgi:pimeloyl-ACP methyl ester carboxylesterase
MAYGDLGASTRAISELAQTGVSCVLGGQNAPGTTAGGYAPFGQTAASFTSIMFANADPEIVAIASQRRLPDPCGDTSLIALGVATDLVFVPTITVPTLLVYGKQDALFPPPAGDLQKQLYLSSHDVTLVTLPGTAHAVTLERTAPVLQATMARWLHAHGV